MHIPLMKKWMTNKWCMLGGWGESLSPRQSKHGWFEKSLHLFPLCIPADLHSPRLLPLLPPSSLLTLFLSFSWDLPKVSSPVSRSSVSKVRLVLMPGCISGADSSSPNGEQQPFSASDHRPPWWVDLTWILSLFLFSVLHHSDVWGREKTTLPQRQLE